MQDPKSPQDENRRALSVSILLSTHGGAQASHLAEALESMFAQTAPADQLVLVIDGPVPPDQEAVIARYRRDRRINQVELVRLDVNSGLANALNAGLPRCAHELIARMDSDDISHPDRLLEQEAFMRAHPEIGVLATCVEEFDQDPDTIFRVNAPPVSHEDIVRKLRWRCVIIHPSLMIRASALKKLGGYRTEFGRLEDYDLFVRAALAGVRFHALGRPLIKVRMTLALYGRRGGWTMFKNEVRFRFFCFRSGFLGPFPFCVTVLLAPLFRITPLALRKQLYRFVRKEWR